MTQEEQPALIPAYDWNNPPPPIPPRENDPQSIDFKPPTLANPSILAEADKIINGDRNEAYGDATPAFTEYAKGASVIFGTDCTAKQVALFMVWMKLCRELHKPKRDNRTDMAGYTGLADQIEEGTK